MQDNAIDLSIDEHLVNPHIAMVENRSGWKSSNLQAVFKAIMFMIVRCSQPTLTIRTIVA